MTKSPQATIFKEVQGWSDRDITALVEMLQGLLEARGQCQESGGVGGGGDRASQQGYIEVKQINGKAYRYLRWRSGGVLRSQYLGKA